MKPSNKKILGPQNIVRFVEINGKRLVIKNPIDINTANYELEVYLYKLLKDHGVSVPDIYYHSESEIILTRLKGESLDDNTDLYNDNDIFKSIAYDLTKIHSVHFDKFGKFKNMDEKYMGEYDSWSSFLNEFTITISKNKYLAENVINTLRDYWIKVIPKVVLKKGSLIHGDFSMDSIFVMDREYVGVIDFGDSIIADPLMDLAYFRFKEINKPYGYQVYKLLLTNYLEKNEFMEKDIDQKIVFYMIYWAISRVNDYDNLYRDKFISKAILLAEYISASLDKN